MVVSVALIDGSLCLRKPFFQAMFFAGRVVELVVLVATVTKNLVRMNFERVSEGDTSTSFDELDGHTR